MTLRVDPEENEIRALRELGGWRGARVLEIGCGDGRLSRRLARLGASVTAIDPDPKRIAAARKALPQRLAGQIRFSTGKAESTGHGDGWFDAVVFAWAL